MNTLKRSFTAAVALLGAKAMGACTGAAGPDLSAPTNMIIDWNAETTFEWNGWLETTPTSTYILYGGGARTTWYEAN